MKVIKTVREMQAIARELKNKKGLSIGLVPTMGYLHDGHLSLMKRARKENDIVIASVFVNPTQFGPNEDYESYPRDLDKDSELAASVGVDYVFSPEVNDMYTEGYNSYVEVLGITNKLCGASRPGHFKGVTTVVTKLFNITMPTRAYFGQKDIQQVYVIKQMVRDLNMSIDIIPCPIVREYDGLAMSSRNSYLSDEERQEALVLNKSLMWAKKEIENGERSAERIILEMKSMINQKPHAKIDYVEILDVDTFKDMKELHGQILIALAVKIGETRLIDNVVMEVH